MFDGYLPSHNRLHAFPNKMTRDVWVSNFSQGTIPLDTWTNSSSESPFVGRFGHGLVYEPPTTNNQKKERLYLIAGEGALTNPTNHNGIQSGGLYLSDVWMYDVEDESSNQKPMDFIGQEAKSL